MSDHTTIVDTITSLFRSADQHRWDDLQNVFADEVRLDYTALAGGEPATLTPADIVDAWRPGFEAIDAHQHLVSNHLVTIDDHTATVEAAFIATHQWNNTTWTLGGNYHFTLTNDADTWRVSTMTMTPVWHNGPSDLIARALDATAERARSAVAVAEDFLRHLGDLDIDGALANFADDGVQEMPYSPNGFPDRLDGLDAIRRQYGGLPDAYTSMTFTITNRHETADPTVVILEYTGTIELKSGGNYDNTYIGVFTVIDDRIVIFREYFDPVVLQTAFGDDVDDTFTLGNDS